MGFPVPTRVTDELINATIWNADLVANMNNSIMHLINRKASDQNIPNTTQTDVTSLVFPVLANEVWRFTMNVIYSAQTAADIKFRFTFPSGGRVNAGIVGFDPALASIYRQFDDTTSPGVEQSFGGSTGVRLTVTIDGVFATAGTGGNVQLQAAQNASDGTPDVIYTNSTTWGAKIA
jgi:hypothetical protein